MNLTDFKKTPIYRVQEMVRREAARYGLTITKAELVGLTPQKAFMDAAKWYLQVDGMDDSQVLEYRLQEEVENEIRLADFVAATASGSPTPGGGSVAALAGALAAALAQMVAGLTAGRKKYAAINDEVQAILAEAETLRLALTVAIDEDAAAFDQVMAVWRNKELDELEKVVAVEQATIGAGNVPLRVARLSRDAALLAQQMAQIGNPNAVTDAAAGTIMAHAAVQAAALNVKINAVSLQDQNLARQWAEEVTTLEAETAVIVQTTKQTAAERGGFG
jgi:glutamate formiminotransferase/formiminotetrahydrofolate cyclodeaminase